MREIYEKATGIDEAPEIIQITGKDFTEKDTRIVRKGYRI